MEQHRFLITPDDTLSTCLREFLYSSLSTRKQCCVTVPEPHQDNVGLQACPVLGTLLLCVHLASKYDRRDNTQWPSLISLHESNLIKLQCVNGEFLSTAPHKPS